MTGSLRRKLDDVPSERVELRDMGLKQKGEATNTLAHVAKELSQLQCWGIAAFGSTYS